ncbi:MAG: hypothetical protein KVP17_002143, partial [Porospora cf. gigantea B]|uniref:uncharacterized protein n=2 Tax=Porospora cf. gigantea B TaxID=2853592 RepID=UPI003571BD72
MSKFQLSINPESPAILPLLLGSVLKESKGITVVSRRDAAVSKGTAVLRSLAKGGMEVTGSETDISIALLGALPEFMGGTDILKRADILYWVNLSKQRSPMALMGLLNERLKMRSFIVSYSLTLADLACIVSLCGQDWTTDGSSSKKFVNCGRWARNVLSILDFAAIITNMMPKVKSESQNRDATKKVGDKPKEERAEMNLPNAVMGAVVTRFPPEPSGYLHIGHAKAALLNNYFAQRYKGKLLIRFDDTNPSKEREEFRESILEDLNLLNVHGDALSYTSDHFGRLIDIMDGLIAKGICYVDDTPVDQMRLERGEGVDSRARLHSIEENQRRWAEMKSGSDEGLKNCVRAKLNMQDKNKCMRDPVMYRCNAETPHHRTGHQFLVYPTYDFACPLVDSWEGVTHAMRTNEYADRIPQYFWVQEVCGVRKCEIYEFSRLNFVNT